MVNMKKLVRAVLLSAVAVIGLSGGNLRGGALPSVDNTIVPFNSFLNGRSGVGPDGNNRFLWDYFNNTLKNYRESVLWIVDPTGNNIGDGSQIIPNVGTGLIEDATSNIALHVSASNNTTLAFAFWDASHTFIQKYGTWTFNPTGKLIAFSGPTGFNGLQVLNIEFERDFVIVTFCPTSVPPGNFFGQGPFSVWVIDQFGNVTSAVGPQGPYAGYQLGSVTTSGPDTSPNQLWHWISLDTPNGHLGLSLQEFNSSGQVLTGFAYGPF
jgi:hypothetical protein